MTARGQIEVDSSLLYNLGICYVYGQNEHVKQDYKQARRCLNLAADAGHAKAQSMLGYLYECGYGGDVDYPKAFEYYKRAANQDDADGQFCLGVFYERGIRGVVPRDYDMARHYYELAANQDDPYAQLNLGTLYANGNGIPVDYVKAREYFELAADRGVEGARDNLYILDWLERENNGGLLRVDMEETLVFGIGTAFWLLCSFTIVLLVAVFVGIMVNLSSHGSIEPNARELAWDSRFDELKESHDSLSSIFDGANEFDPSKASWDVARKAYAQTGRSEKHYESHEILKCKDARFGTKLNGMVQHFEPARHYYEVVDFGGPEGHRVFCGE